jgi:hypothetical protein
VSGISCHADPYLNLNPYGPVAPCVQVEGNQARPGTYSPVTAAFTPSGEGSWFTIYSNICPSYQSSTIKGCVLVSTGFGPILFATQYSGNQGRWGTCSPITNGFSASSGWFPVVT